MRYHLIFWLIVLTAVSEGCGDVYRVKVHDAAHPAGIPFFSNSGACTQETVYANPYYLVTLKVTGTSGVLLSDMVKLSGTGHRSADFQGLVAEMEKAQPDFGSVQTAWGLLKQRQSFDPYTQSDGEFTLSNKSKAITVIDYGHPYSLNERKPMAGSVSADYKLNADGTLAEAQGQVQENTLSTILGALPLADLIKSAAGIATKTGAAAAQPPEAVHFVLDQQERIRTKTYSITTKYVENCPAGTSINSTTSGATLLVADIGSGDLSDKKEGKEDSTIGISGSISLPKGLVTSPAPKDGAGNKADQGSAGAWGTSSTGSKDKQKNSTGNSGSGH